MSVFVTGTGTDVGKSVVCAWLVQHWQARYWKPIQSGVPADEETIRSLAPAAAIHPSRHRLSQPLSPHLAAARDGVALNLADFTLPPGTGPVVVEGAGGILVPLNERHCMIDLMAHLGLPVLVVGRSGLGTINHTLLSLQALRQRGLTVAGVVLNGPANDDNARAIQHFAQVPVLATLPPLTPLTATTLAATPCPIPPL